MRSVESCSTGRSAAQDRGQNEVAGSLSYTDIADVSTTSIDVSYGRYLRPQHEVGMNVAYVDTDVDGLGSVDGTTLGAFYQFNFDSGGNMVPFIGADVAYIGGDLGDAYDFGYGVSAGAKYYPYEHVGVIIGIAARSFSFTAECSCYLKDSRTPTNTSSRSNSRLHVERQPAQVAVRQQPDGFTHHLPWLHINTQTGLEP